MRSFTFQQYSWLLLDHLRGNLPPEVSVGVFGTPQNYSSWDFGIEARRGGQKYSIAFSIDSRPYKQGQRAQVDIAADARHLARLCRLGLGMELPNPENAMERLYWAKLRVQRLGVRPDCRYYAGHSRLKCAVNPMAGCRDCSDFEVRE